MKMQSYEQRFLIPDEGKLLCNYKEKIISEQVFLAKEDDGSDWTEIDAEDKVRLEAECEAEALAEVEG